MNRVYYAFDLEESDVIKPYDAEKRTIHHTVCYCRNDSNGKILVSFGYHRKISFLYAEHWNTLIKSIKEDRKELTDLIIDGFMGEYLGDYKERFISAIRKGKLGEICQ